MTMFYHCDTFISLFENPMRRLASLLTLSLFPLLGGCSSARAKTRGRPQPKSAFINQAPSSKPVYTQGVSKGTSPIAPTWTGSSRKWSRSTV